MINIYLSWNKNHDLFDSITTLIIKSEMFNIFTLFLSIVIGVVIDDQLA